MKVHVVLPTYNEKENIEAMVTQLRDLPLDLKVLVVDDNSPDGTGAIADRMAAETPGKVQVIHRAGKLGLGTAYIAGFREAMEDHGDAVVTMDADFSHPPEKIPEMVAKLQSGYDLVIGSRYVPGGKTVDCTLPRRFLSRVSNLIASTLLGLPAKDATAGFRCYRREVLESIDLGQIRSNGYSFLTEMLYKVRRRNWKIAEVPIVFRNRRHGVSKISRNEILKAIYTVFRLFKERLLGRPA
ncbi:MAG: polyprenol monophosphomannose synthase [Anaerolineae bacterium]|nr:polyprenol monophosphomannose synthase [Anaerolineae bacterium]